MKPKVEFKTDIKLDAWNYVDCVKHGSCFGYDFTKHMNQKLVRELKKKNKKAGETYMKKILKENYIKENIEEKLQKIKKNWGKVERKYFSLLEKLTKRKIYTNKFWCYATTINRCPYDYKNNNFMISTKVNSKLHNNIIAHELMHLQFHYYFEKKLREKLSFQQFHDLKEALTILLNIEFKGLSLAKDIGYSSHQELRKFIAKTWKQEKDFERLLERCVKHLKK